MICQPCINGSTWNRKWRDSGHSADLFAAEAEHAKCEGCCCQHSVGADSLKVVPL